MIDPVAARPAGTLATEIGQIASGVSHNPGAVTPGDEALFEQALNAPRTDNTLTLEIAPPVAQPETWVIPAPAQPAGVLSVGERILEGMNSFKESWAGTVDSMKTLASRTEMQPSEMMQIQFQIGYSSLMLSTVSQEVGSISQKIDGLLKTG